MAAINEVSAPIDWIRNRETPRDLWLWLHDLSCEHHCAMAVIEQVHSMPKQGVSSTFKFGESFGFLRGILTASSIRHDSVTPAKWQGDLRCRKESADIAPTEHKRRLKAKAQQLFPSQRMTLINADAFLLAEYAKQLDLKND